MSSRRYKTVGWILLILVLTILLLYLVRLVIVLMEENSHPSSSLPIIVVRAKVTPGQGWGIGHQNKKGWRRPSPLANLFQIRLTRVEPTNFGEYTPITIVETVSERSQALVANDVG